MAETVSAQKARLNFGEMLNDVYYRKRVFTIERKGKAMAKLIPMEGVGKRSEEDRLSKLMQFAGTLDPEVGGKMIEMIYKERKLPAHGITQI